MSTRVGGSYSRHAYGGRKLGEDAVIHDRVLGCTITVGEMFRISHYDAVDIWECRNGMRPVRYEVLKYVFEEEKE